MRRLSELSIRTVLGLVIGIPGLLLVALGVGGVLDAIERQAGAKKIATLAPISQLLFKTLQDTRLERGNTIAALHTDAPVEHTVEADILRQRRAAEASYEAAGKLLAAVEVPGLVAPLARLKAAHEAVDALRPKAEAAMHAAKSQRDAELVQEWPRVTQAYLDALQAASLQLETTLLLVDPVIDQLLTVKQAAWTARNHGGAMVLRLGSAMAAGKSWSQAEVMAHAEDRGRIAGAWAIVTTVASLSTTPKSVADAAATAAVNFSGSIADERVAIAQALSAGRKPDVEAQDFLHRSIGPLGLIGEVATTALGEMVARANGQHSAATKSLVLDGLLLLAALTFMVAGLAIAQRRVSSPIRILTATMRRLAGHDLATEIPGADRGDEIGEMSRAVEVFKQNMIAGDRLAAEQQAERDKREQRQTVIDTSIKSFERTVAASLEMLSAASGGLQNTAQSMSATAEQTTRKTTAAASASEIASSNVQTVAAAAEELSTSIAEISRQVTESVQIARQAVDDAGRTNTQVKTLAEAAQKIGDVVKLINDIAGQTNLLALNATIEAARAGEAGKGFAVVASEVKNLAAQTAKATGDIAAQVTAIQSATGESVQAIEAITGTISRINEIATTIASAVEEQRAATDEIARSVQQASSGTIEVASNIVGVTEAAAETGSASTEVLGAAGELAKQGETLRAEVGQFLSDIRAA